MGSMVFSMLSMFAPYWVQFVFFIVICIGFRIYVSHEERKKFGEREEHQQERLETLRK